MHSPDSHTSDSSAVLSTVDPRIFPISIIKYALFTLSDRIEGHIVEKGDEEVVVKLTPLVALAEEEMERAWNQALLTTSVNEHTFQTSAPIRNFLAQTALSITTQTQQTVDEFVADMISQRDVEHAGAPSSHIDIPAATAEEREARLPYRTKVNENEGTVDIMLDVQKYLLPDVLWAAQQMRDVSVQFVLNQAGSQLMTRLEPKESTVELETLAEQFVHWLDIAVERDRRKVSNG